MRSKCGCCWKRWPIDNFFAILAGERSPALADDPALNYADAVELRLLLEALAN